MLAQQQLFPQQYNQVQNKRLIWQHHILLQGKVMDDEKNKTGLNQIYYAHEKRPQKKCLHRGKHHFKNSIYIIHIKHS